MQHSSAEEDYWRRPFLNHLYNLQSLILPLPEHSMESTSQLMEQNHPRDSLAITGTQCDFHDTTRLMRRLASRPIQLTRPTTTKPGARLCVHPGFPVLNQPWTGMCSPDPGYQMTKRLGKYGHYGECMSISARHQMISCLSHLNRTHIGCAGQI